MAKQLFSVTDITYVKRSREQKFAWRRENVRYGEKFHCCGIHAYQAGPRHLPKQITSPSPSRYRGDLPMPDVGPLLPKNKVNFLLVERRVGAFRLASPAVGDWAVLRPRALNPRRRRRRRDFPQQRRRPSCTVPDTRFFFFLFLACCCARSRAERGALLIRQTKTRCRSCVCVAGIV
jgi:hypothetical protein